MYFQFTFLLFAIVHFCNGAAIPEETAAVKSETRLDLGSIKDTFNKAKNPTCMNELDQAQMVTMIKEMTDLVEKGLTKGSSVITDEDVRNKVKTEMQTAMDSWKGGWDKPDIIDSISSAIADPLKQIPHVGPTVSFAVRKSIKAYLKAKKKAAGC